ncbi:glycosyltransferase family 4 protein [Synechococcus sp. CS-602]|uniref:glycosyltransferase family 4 protein n=1 Tax=Synechococcaceae TaxID=1890426 RepID=UPI0008FF0E48|nr:MULTISPECIES: glycosyltransferase family 1 protein [Synechococcaceae]MCT4365818.1 glycosyltransferase family 4 protein [Candidatus Regnicoccus frigidus MAG-AL1]APD48076.1 hypothetical protein BM449_07200 [Synechococcus sp. SynAce01]MCT0203032.1 glycosyltransferase family 4 protein [Synechococcus sp. CS-603]MCT0203930.1 glycosyltransferase family 4 protein [Synechococcus sp. CS-602]MCT0245531.1 glycosyltransferase family 4 protein [Synechococcus sp. CS-601]
MSGLKVAFDVSQTGGRKAGCGYYAASLIEGLLTSDVTNEFTLLTSFGDFFHDPTLAFALPHLGQGIRYGPRLLRRKDAEIFWRDHDRGGHFLEQFDVVHANNFWCPPWPMPGALIYTLYDMSFLDHPEWTTEKNRRGCLEGVERAVTLADKFVAISEATKQSFLKHFPQITPEKVHVIYPASRFGQPGFNAAPKRPRQEIFNIGNPFFLSIGTIEPRKNQTFLLDVYHQYRHRGGEATPLVLAGKKGWLMDDFEEKIVASPWASDIFILGYVSDGELAWLYQHCLVNLYPSHYEGFGLPVLEGMAFGACTLCSNSTSMPEIVGDAGILLPPDDLERWVHALESVVSETEKRISLKEEALKRSTSFQWEQSIMQTLSLYEKATR